MIMIIMTCMVIVRRLMRQHKSVVLAVPPAVLRLAGLAASDYVRVSFRGKGRTIFINKLELGEVQRGRGERDPDR